MRSTCHDIGPQEDRSSSYVDLPGRETEITEHSKQVLVMQGVPVTYERRLLHVNGSSVGH